MSGTEMSKGITQFANNFYLQCVEEKSGNVIISPLSVYNALGLLAQGANEITYKQLQKTLQLGDDKSVTAKQFLELQNLLGKNAGESAISIANGIYIQQGYELSKSFQDVAESKFKSCVQSINFTAAENSANTINQFVEEKTNGKIEELFKADQFDSDTRMILVNAIYFKGNWEIPFLEEEGWKGDFYNSETEKVSVDFMFNYDWFNTSYIEDLDASVLEMKYANSNISFVIVLPVSRTGLRALESKLEDYDMAKIAEGLEPEKTQIVIPKFKVEYEIQLNNVLKNLGVTEIFSNAANLSGILNSGEQLKVTDAVHKAVLEIDEKGSEAAAGSGFISCAI